MILKYIWKNFSRRKVRTGLMILALLVSMGLIITMSATVETVRQSNVDLIASEVGRYDLSITRPDINPDPFINIAATTPLILSANNQIIGVYPRFEVPIELAIGSELANATLLALDPSVDNIGFIQVIEGNYALGNGQVAVLADTANGYGLTVGDRINVSYSYPLPREQGKIDPAGSSQRRTAKQFTISSIVRQDGLTQASVREGIIMDLGEAQSWLQLPNQAQRLVVTVNPNLYETSNAEVAALRMRAVAQAVQAVLGQDYQYNIDKAAALDGSAAGFLAIQALLSVYGLTALGVVGLLVHTLVMTNVQEQRRDMAILRILGGRRNYLFNLVITEILVIGTIGIGAGVIMGQLITAYIVVPIIQKQFEQIGLTSQLHPQVTLSAILPAVIAAFIVLILSTLKPAQDASRTKVMYAINPSVADNIQIEDLAKLRERRPDGKLFVIGLALLAIFALIAGFQAIEAFGNPALQVIFFLLALGVLILGVGFTFFITTVPFERLVLLVMALIAGRLTFFASRNVGRGQTRNTLISLLVLFSGVLPSFLATQVALDQANLEGSVRQQWGSPLSIEAYGWWLPEEEAVTYRLTPSFLTDELQTVPGIGTIAATSHPFNSTVADTIGLRSAPVSVLGVYGPLADVLYPELVEFTAGDKSSLSQIQRDPSAIIISEGLAQHLSLTVGNAIQIVGAGRDHTVTFQIIAIARRLPGQANIGQSRTQAQSGSTALIGLDAFRALKTELGFVPPPPNAPILVSIFAALTPNSQAQEVQEALNQRYSRRANFWIRLTETDLEESRRNQASQRIFLLVLTVISFTTAVFGVFAVIYVTIYARRIEIGMLKAIGMRQRELTGMLVVEAITMTLGAALAGIAAGATMGYVATLGIYALQQRPIVMAVDTTVMPFIVFMVVLASVIGAAFSARRIVKKRAVEILRM